MCASWWRIKLISSTRGNLASTEPLFREALNCRQNAWRPCLRRAEVAEPVRIAFLFQVSELRCHISNNVNTTLSGIGYRKTSSFAIFTRSSHPSVISFSPTYGSPERL